MTQERIRFSKEDIGAEILPILTSGLYRDTLDALREYVQNSIDADSNHIEISIDPDVVSVIDDGIGMTLEQAKRAMRLGISDKNPLINVGFRGIGIYSAFNLCDYLEIYTKSELENDTYLISFDFREIRRALLEEQERRRQSLPPELYLERLLEESVSVEIVSPGTISEHGTIAILSKVLSDAYLRLNDWNQVMNYLQDVVPLPFNSSFRYAEVIQSKFDLEDYRVVPLTLQIGQRKQKLYRPYTNDIFEYEGKYRPEFFELKSGKEQFGFAWACVNDARKVIKDKSIRGLLIKKQGFSIANRQFLEPFFTRPVFSRRMTGEVIVNHPSLVPNAARSDFEHNPTRQNFFEKVLPKLTSEASSWANEKQEDARAEEVLAQLKKQLIEINAELPNVQRDNDRLLKINIELGNMKRLLTPHQKRLKLSQEQSLLETQELLKGIQNTVKEFLTGQRKKSERIQEEVVKAVQRKETTTTPMEEEQTESIPKNLVELLDAYALLDSKELREFLTYLDDNILKVHLSDKGYVSALDEMRTFLEDIS